jgi:hypothetical protein
MTTGFIEAICSKREKKKNKDNNRMIRIDERASNGQQAASKWTMGGMVLFTGRTLSTMISDESEEEEEPYLEKCMFVHSTVPYLPHGRNGFVYRKDVVH